MTYPKLALVVLLAAALAVSESTPDPAVADSGFRIPCSQGKTIIRTAEARYFGHKGQRWGCLTGQRRAWFIGHSGSDDCAATCTMDLPVLAGKWLGYAGYRVERDGTYRVAAVVDLRTGRKVRRDLLPGDTPVTDVAVSRSGRLGYIVRLADGTFRVALNDRTGLRTVEQSGSIDPSSLVIVGGEARWTSGGQTRTAPVT